MNLLEALSLALLAALAGCSKPEPVIVLDGAWDVESARNACAGASDWFQENSALIARFGCERFISCQPMTVIVNACRRDPDQQVQEFEAELAAEFAAAAECASVHLVNLASPNERNMTASDAMKRQHWNLGLDFSPGAPKQQWTMTNSGDQSSFTQGEGDPHEMAVGTCTVIRQAGAG
jgi:hypothetical protein